MDHSFCVGSHLYGLFKILFNLIQCWLWVGCGLVFQMGFPYIPDNAVQIIMKYMAVKIVLLYLTQFQRPHIQIIFSRCVFFKNALPGSFQNQIHLVHPHISDLVNKDFHINHKVCALVLSVALCAGMAAPAFAYGGEPVEEVEQPVLTSTTDEEDVVTVTDEETGALTPEGNLTLVDDYHTNYSDGSGQQFITLVSKSGATFYLVIDRNAKGQQTVHFMNLVDEADLLTLMEEDAADAYTAEKEAAAQAEQDKLKAEEEAKKAAEEAAASGEEQPKENKVTKIASGFLGVVVLIALAAGGGFYAFTKQKQKKQAEKEALDPDANYTEDKGDFEIPVEDEPEEPGEEDTEPI